MAFRIIEIKMTLYKFNNVIAIAKCFCIILIQNTTQNLSLKYVLKMMLINI